MMMSTLKELKAKGLVPCKQVEVHISLREQKAKIVLVTPEKFESGKAWRLTHLPALELSLYDPDDPNFRFANFRDAGQTIIEAMAKIGVIEKDSVTAIVDMDSGIGVVN